MQIATATGISVAIALFYRPRRQTIQRAAFVPRCGNKFVPCGSTAEACVVLVSGCPDKAESLWFLAARRARWVVSVRPRGHRSPDPKLATIRRKPAYALSCRGEWRRYCGAIGLDVGSTTTRDPCHDPVPARSCDFTWPDPTRIVGGQRAAVDVGGRRAGARHRAEAGRHADQPADAGAADPGPRRERPGADADRGQQDLSGADHVFADAGADRGAR